VNPTDAELCAGLRRRERAAFDEVYARYHARIFRFLLRLTGRRSDAEDLFQETWISVAKSADRLAEDTDLPAWLFTVARNRHTSFRRWSMVHWLRTSALSSAPPEPSAPPDRDADARETAALLERTLAELAPAHREALLLVAVEGLSQQQVAEVLGIRHDTLRQRLSRARAELAERLDAASKPGPRNADGGLR
jgi:RNA polymerase sigma-70 factor (ECF subfamily)